MRHLYQDAVAGCRQRCWRYDWVVDLDIKGFFDNIDHHLMMHAVRKHTDNGNTNDPEPIRDALGIICAMCRREI